MVSEAEIAAEVAKHLSGAGVGPDCRWVYSRKRAVVLALRRWPEQTRPVLSWLQISEEEAEDWLRRYAREGDSGLMATHR